MAVEALIYGIEDGTYEYVIYGDDRFVGANYSELGADCCEIVARGSAALGIEPEVIRDAIERELKETWGHHGSV